MLQGQGSSGPEPEVRRERRERPRNARRPPREVETAAPVKVQPSDTVQPAERLEEPTTAAHARLGSEGLTRLRARFSEMLARIDERVGETDRREEPKSLAERLNPDVWVTDADVAAGLESYETTFASLRAAIGPRRRPDAPASSSDQRD
jgi:hypothetical protein